MKQLQVATLLQLASEVHDPKWTTRTRVRDLVYRVTGGDVYAYNSIVSFLHSQGWIDEAFLIFDRMRIDEIEPNLMSFNSLINCYLARYLLGFYEMHMLIVRSLGVISKTQPLCLKISEKLSWFQTL